MSAIQAVKHIKWTDGVAKQLKWEWNPGRRCAVAVESPWEERRGAEAVEALTSLEIPATTQTPNPRMSLDAFVPRPHRLVRREVRGSARSSCKGGWLLQQARTLRRAEEYAASQRHARAGQCACASHGRPAGRFPPL